MHSVERAALRAVPAQPGPPLSHGDDAGASAIRRRLAAAESALLLGRVREAATLLDEADRHAPVGDLAMEIVRVRARLAMMGGPAVPGAVDLIEAAAAGAAPAQAARLLMEAVGLAIFTHQLPRVLDLARRCKELASDDDGDLQAAADAAIAVSVGMAGDLEDALPVLGRQLDSVAVAASPVAGVHLLQQIVVILSALHRHAEAARHAQRFVGAIRENGALGVLPLALALQAHMSFWAGLWDSGVQAAAESIRLAEDLDQQAVVAYASAMMALYAGGRGREQPCRAAAARAFEVIDVTGTEMFRGMAYGGLGLLELSRGDVHAAVAVFDRIGTTTGSAALVYWWPDTVEALLGVGRRDDALALLEPLERRAPEPSAQWQRMMLARCRALLAPDSDVDAMYGAAIEAQQVPAAAYPLARTLFSYGRRLLDLDRVEDARARLTEALTGFEDLGAVGWERRARRLLDEIGPESPATEVPLSAAVQPDAPIDVRLLGGFGIAGVARVPRGVLGQAVRYVALRGGAVPVEELVEVLWPEQDPEVTRPRLRNVVNRVRSLCGPVLARDRDTVRLVHGLRVDVAVFEAAAARALAGHDDRVRWAEAAVTAYAGELLPLDRLLEWTIAPRERLARLYVQMLDILAQSTRGDEQLRWLERAADADPYDDSRFVEIARLHLAAGRRARAVDALARAARVTKELGVAPPPAIDELLPR